MEQALHATIIEFSKEIYKLEGKKPGSACTLSITLSGPSRYDSKALPKIKLTAHFYDGGEYQTVQGASLGAVMDEVYRRLGFADKEALRVDQLEATLQALPSPDDIEAANRELDGIVV
jgi:hypothetical protein